VNGERLKDSIEYLDNCLECSACETVCPSGVQYTSILEHARNDMKLNNYSKGFTGLIRKISFKSLLPNRFLLRIIRALTNFITMLIPLHRFIKIVPRFEDAYHQIKTNYYYRSKIELADISDIDRTLTMPLGCVMDTVYNHVHWDTIKVLNEFGYHVYIPDSNCCGALAYHSGEPNMGLKQLRNTVQKLTELPENSLHSYPIVMNSAGCGAFLKNHTDLKTLDLIEALQQAPANPMKADFMKVSLLKEAPRSKIIATYHPACHLNHQQGLANDYVDLLKQIPNLELMPLYEADMCCGSAGFYNLIKSKMANEIGKRKAKFIKNTGAKIVLTANPGCMSQIQAHLGDEYKVLHPVSLIKGYLESRA
jgi:glycolate oxidase iron-sulfur subunit